MAGKIARKGLRIVDKMLDGLAGLADDEPKRWPANYARQVTDCVLAAVKVQAEERAQLEFEAGANLAPEDIRAAMIEWLRSLPAAEKQALMAEAGLAPPTVPTTTQEAQPHA